VRAPLAYNGDGLLILVIIKRVMEGTWLFQSNLMGAPFGSSLYDYPIPDSGSLFVLKWLGRLSDSPIAAFNIYYLLGFPINALSAYFVLRRLRLSMALSFVGGFVFTMLPFHFERIGHLFYTWYFAVPIFIWYAFKLYRGEFSVEPGTLSGLKSILKPALVLLVISCFGVYYSFFGALTFITAGLMRYLHTQSTKSVFSTIFAVVILTVGIGANITPNLIDRFEHKLNQETAKRSPTEAELYGLKTAQLLLPRLNHRFAPFANLTNKYATTFPLVNENMTASLGFIGSIGFITLLLSFLSSRIQEDERVFVLAGITLSLLLFCSVGGFSALFAVLISPMIRAWNRVSVFIAFTSISTTLLMVQALLSRRWARRHLTRWTAATAIGLCAFAFWDQTTPLCAPCLSWVNNDFHNDAQFVADIEKQVPAGSAIYQLPYVGFPEVEPVNKLGAYDQGRGYLNSKTLKWSWGAIKGRTGDTFFRSLAAESIENQIKVARKLCFRGVYVDRRGYADGGVKIEAELKRILGEPPTLISGTKQQFFFSLAGRNHPACSLPSKITQQEIMERAALLVDDTGLKYKATLSDGMTLSRVGTPTFLAGIEGLSDVEDWGRWSDASLSPDINLHFAHPLPASFVLHLRVRAFGPNAGIPTQVIVGDEVRTFTPTAETNEYVLSFSNIHGTDRMTIKPPHAVSPADLGMSADIRKLGLGMERIWIETPR
jgi:phosphoglycerol transferase